MGRKKFNDHPFPYHHELELEISTLTNLGVGLGRISLAGGGVCHVLRDKLPGPKEADSVLQRPQGEAGWVVMVPFALPGERVRARVFRNHKNFSEADLLEVLTPSPDRVAPRCSLFGQCGGCQYQHLAYEQQLAWKQRQVRELLQHLAGLDFAVAAIIASPRAFGYRSKITPHFAAPRPVAGLGKAGPGSPTPATSSPALGATAGRANRPGEPAAAAPGETPRPALPIGFLRQSSRFDLVDVPRCAIATDAINARLTEVRATVQARAAAGEYQRGATLLLREASGQVTTDYDAIITEEVSLTGPGGAGPEAATPPLRLRFLARDFFQNNPLILPAFARYVRTQAAASGARFLVDAYCGSGLFALACAPAFERVAGVEIGETSGRFARENAAANGVTNASFLVGDAAAIFAGLDFPPTATAVVIDPPRKGCDETFLRQLFAFGPRAIVYVSCDPATQMRDLKDFLAHGYRLTAVQPFDLFPQTRHLECVITLSRAAGETTAPVEKTSSQNARLGG